MVAEDTAARASRPDPARPKRGAAPPMLPLAYGNEARHSGLAAVRRSWRVDRDLQGPRRLLLVLAVRGARPDRPHFRCCGLEEGAPPRRRLKGIVNAALTPPSPSRLAASFAVHRTPRKRSAATAPDPACPR